MLILWKTRCKLSVFQNKNKRKNTQTKSVPKIDLIKWCTTGKEQNKKPAKVEINVERNLPGRAGCHRKSNIGMVGLTAGDDSL